MVFLHIKDEGIGLTEEQITQIIDKSTLSTSGTMGEKGNGLGLFLVIELLERINVPLEIKSELGKGSTFTLKLNLMNSNKLN
jgi:signal transduction histidine kinase